MLLGDCKPESRRPVFRVTRQYRKAFVAASPRFFEDTVEGSPVTESLMFTERKAVA
jgi:hypothetical protein